jgi:outer membrane lipoprotein carrier protein
MKKWIGFITLLTTTQAWTQTPAETLQERLHAMKTLKANFTQVVKTKKKKVSESSGTMALSRPGCFRWHTLSPLKQLVVADGKKIWIYDVDLEQVVVKKQGKGIGGTAALFLSGYNDAVSRNFNVKETKTGKTERFDLKSKSSKDSFHKVTMVFKDGILQSMQMHDQLGQTTNVHLSNIQQNPPLSAKICVFKPPKGVDVVRQ